MNRINSNLKYIRYTKRWRETEGGTEERKERRERDTHTERDRGEGEEREAEREMERDQGRPGKGQKGRETGVAQASLFCQPRPPEAVVKEGESKLGPPTTNTRSPSYPRKLVIKNL